MKELWKNIYHRKNERLGLSIMLLLIIVALFFRYIYLNHAEPENEKYSDLISEVEFETAPSYSTKKKQRTSNRYSKTSISAEKKFQRFKFDPNTISGDSLTLLGFPSFVGSNLENYRAKGGLIKKPEDLRKIYGAKEHYDEVADLISINKIIPFKGPKKIKKKVDSTSYSFKKKEEIIKKVVEINSADSTELLYLRGIGPFWAKTILEYREKLGGFYSPNQLTEAFGTPDTIVEVIGREWIRIDTSLIKKININTADFKTLVKHPYTNASETNAVLTYRKVHGNYKSISDIKKIHLIDEQDFNLLRPYITVE